MIYNVTCMLCIYNLLQNLAGASSMLLNISIQSAVILCGIFVCTILLTLSRSAACSAAATAAMATLVDLSLDAS